MNSNPPSVSPEVALRSLAVRYTQYSPRGSLILTPTSPVLLLSVSLFRIKTPQVQQLSSPQMLMEAEVPEVTTVFSIQGMSNSARSANSNAAQRGEGVQPASLPNNPCFDPFLNELQKLMRKPSANMNSIIISIAHIQAAKESVNPGTPIGSSTNRRSLMVPRYLLKSCRYDIPSTVIRRFINCEVQLSDSRFWMVRREGSGKTTALRVKNPQQRQMSPSIEYQEESAEAVVPGPVITTPYTMLLTVLQSRMNQFALQLLLMPSSWQRFPLSTSSMLQGCLAVLQSALMKGMQMLLTQSVVKEMLVWSQPMLKAQYMEVLQMKLPSAYRSVWLLRSRLQVEELAIMPWRVQLKRYPAGICAVCSKTEYQLPWSWELSRYF